MFVGRAADLKALGNKWVCHIARLTAVSVVAGSLIFVIGYQCDRQHHVCQLQVILDSIRLELFVNLIKNYLLHRLFLQEIKCIPHYAKSTFSRTQILKRDWCALIIAAFARSRGLHFISIC